MISADQLLELPSTFITGLLKVLTDEKSGYALAVAVSLILLDVFFKGWKASFSRKMISSSFASLTIMILNVLFVPAVYFAVGWVESGYQSLGIPHIPQSVWAGVPFWIAGIIAIMAHDFADYWSHRAMHYKWLWPVHAIHHSDHHVNGFTTFRVHFLEALVMNVSYILLLTWAGFSPEAAAFGATLKLMHNVYVHADVDWDHGPLKLLIASPRFHRWHHADEPRAYGKNLANFMPLYDYLFGTYYNPHPCRSVMGAKGVPQTDVIKLMLFPFTEWYRLAKKRFRHHNSREVQITGDCHTGRKSVT